MKNENPKIKKLNFKLKKQISKYIMPHVSYFDRLSKNFSVQEKVPKIQKEKKQWCFMFMKSPYPKTHGSCKRQL